jgi:hypothetical protein
MTWLIEPGWNMSSTPLGSVSFNGTNQYLTAPNNTAFAFGTGQFTIEFWIYVTALPAVNAMLYDPRPATTNTVYPVIFLASDGSIRYSVSGVTQINSGAGTITTGQWYHIALTRAGTLQTLWINGEQPVASYTSGTLTYLSSAPNIGAGYNATASINSFFNGYMSNIRVVKGQNVYVSIFAVPTYPLTAVQARGPWFQYGNPVSTDTNIAASATSGIDNIPGTAGIQTSLLLNTPNDANYITDTSSNGFTITNNGSVPAQSLTPFVYGTPAQSWLLQSVGTPGSLQLGVGPGSNQYFKVPYSSNFDFGSGNFTVELWANKTADAVDRLVNGWNTATTQAASWSMNNATAGFTFTYSTAGTTVTTTTLTAPGASGVTVATGYWYHLAAVRNGNVFSFYINGKLAASSTNAITLQTPNTVTIGARASGAVTYTDFYDGLLSNIRVVKGVAVYPADFTPATQQLPATQAANVYGSPSAAIIGTQTSLLLTTPNNPDVDVDSSTNNLTLTPVAYTTYPVAYNTSNPFVNGFSSYTGTPVPTQGSLGSASTARYLLVNTVGVFPFLSNATVDWTVECWFAVSALPAVVGYLMGNTFAVTNSGINLGVTPTGLTFNIASAAGASYRLTLTPTVSWILNSWYHVAVTYQQSTNTVTIYLNGVSVAAGSPTGSSATASTLGFYMMYIVGAVTTTYFSGITTNFRVVNGVVVYTGNFTVPTAPLAATQSAGTNISAITGAQTALLVNAPYLTNQAYSDSSPSNYGLLGTANPYSLPASPFIT